MERICSHGHISHITTILKMHIHRLNHRTYNLSVNLSKVNNERTADQIVTNCTRSSTQAFCCDFGYWNISVHEINFTAENNSQQTCASVQQELVKSLPTVCAVIIMRTIRFYNNAAKYKMVSVTSVLP